MKNSNKKKLQKLYAEIRKPFVLAFAFFICSSVVFTLLVKPMIDANDMEQYYKTYEEAAKVVAKIEQELYLRINMNRALSAHIEQNPNLTQQQFSSFVSSLIRSDGGVISSMSNEKDLKISLIAPYEFNKKALGLDLTIKPHRKEGLLRAIQTDKAYIEGPCLLEQDNLGIVSYIPIYIKDNITGKTINYGVSDVVLLWDRFMEVCGLNEENKFIDIAIRGENGWGENGSIFYGDTNIFNKENTVKIPITLPLGQWVLAAYPKTENQSEFITLAYIYAVIFGLSVIIYLIVRSSFRQLLDSEKKYKDIVENTRDAIWKLDLRTNTISYMTDAQTKITQIPAAEYIGKPPSFVFPEFFANRSMLAAEKMLAGESDSYTLEVQEYRADGSLVWCEISAHVAYNDKGEPIELVGIAREIEKRKQMEARLSESEQKYRDIVENTRDAIWKLDLQTQTLSYMSDAQTKITQIPAAEYIGKPVSFVFLPHSVDTAMQTLGTMLQGGEVAFTLEVQEYRADGSPVWCEIAAHISCNDKGEPIELVGITREIEDRKQMEAQLHESEQKYKIIAKNTNETIWTMDLATMKFTFISEACFEITGYTSEETLNMTFNEILLPEYVIFSQELIKRETDRYMLGETDKISATYEAQQYHKDGHLMWIEISARMLFNSEGQPFEILGITKNIDERKQNEALIHKQHNELLVANSTKDKFFSIIAHDLRNPVAALVNIAELFTYHYGDMSAENIYNSVENLSRYAGHIYRLLENLLDWARSSTGQISYYPIQNNLKEIVIGATNHLNVQANLKNIEINIIMKTNDVEVICDANMIETVVRNLVSNAIKFSHNETIITVTIDNQNDDYVMVSVQDSGVGMDNDTLEKLFKITEKVTTKGTNNETGTGLGLILCKEFIEKHNCKIWAESIIGQGTTFSFTLNKAT